MEAGYGNGCTKFEKIKNPPAPPCCAPLTSFTLKRGGDVKESGKSTTFPIASECEPICMETKPEMSDSTAYKQVLIHRPWIIFDQSSHYKPDESHTERRPMDLPLNAGCPKRTIHGCPNCSNCLKVTARWRPEDARREVLEEAPIFHPTEEEFKDTLKYIASIRSRAEPYGICRIVPPICWKPPCLLEKKNIWDESEFVAQIQRIDGHQVQYAQDDMASCNKNTKTKRKRNVEVALDSQLGNRNTSIPNNQNVKECDCESEPGPKFSLKTFKKYADEFKNQYFNYKDKNKIIGSDVKLAICKQWEPSVENIEGEYGRIVQNPTEEIKVLCGNTLEAGVFGSGFPAGSDPLEAYTYPEYLKSGWNLNTILSLQKVEEHHLYSLSYLHLGEPKVWYGVPGRFSVNFETIWKKYLLDLQSVQPDMHDNLGTQLSCSILKAEGIPVYRCVQYPREFVLVFPGVYYSGFDCGFNCSEAVSFAPLEWLLHGQNVVDLYCEQRRKTLLSYDKLLLGAAREAVKAQWETGLCMKNTSDKLTYKDAYQRNEFLTKALSSRIQSESLKRKFLCTSLVSQRMDENFDATCKRECSICLRDLHLSAVGCSCSHDKFACLDHAKQLCSCTWSNKILFYRYEIGDLNVLCQALGGKLSAVYKWAKEDLGLTLNSVASKRSKQSPDVSGSIFPWQDMQMRKALVSQTPSDSSMGKCHQVQEILNSSKRKQNELVSNSSQKKQNEVASQRMWPTSGGLHRTYDICSKMKTSLLQSTFSDDMDGTNSVGSKIDKKTLGAKFTISKKVGDPEVSKVPLVTNLQYLSFPQENKNIVIDLTSDSKSTSSSSDSEDVLCK